MGALKSDTMTLPHIMSFDRRTYVDMVLCLCANAGWNY